MKNFQKISLVGLTALMAGLLGLVMLFAVSVGPVSAQTTTAAATTAATTTAATTTSAVTTAAVTTAAVTTAAVTTPAATTAAVTTVAVTTSAATVSGANATPTIGGQGGAPGVPATGLGANGSGTDNGPLFAALTLLFITLVIGGGFLVARSRNHRV